MVKSMKIYIKPTRGPKTERVRVTRATDKPTFSSCPGSISIDFCGSPVLSRLRRVDERASPRRTRAILRDKSDPSFYSPVISVKEGGCKSGSDICQLSKVSSPYSSDRTTIFECHAHTTHGHGGREGKGTVFFFHDLGPPRGGGEAFDRATLKKVGDFIW